MIYMMLFFASSIKTIFFEFGFTPCKAQQPRKGMQLQEKEAQKD